MKGRIRTSVSSALDLFLSDTHTHTYTETLADTHDDYRDEVVAERQSLVVQLTEIPRHQPVITLRRISSSLWHCIRRVIDDIVYIALVRT